MDWDAVCCYYGYQKGVPCYFLYPEFNVKSSVMHLYPALMECGNGCLAFQGGGRLEKDSG